MVVYILSAMGHYLTFATADLFLRILPNSMFAVKYLTNVCLKCKFCLTAPKSVSESADH